MEEIGVTQDPNNEGQTEHNQVLIVTSGEQQENSQPQQVMLYYDHWPIILWVK